MEDDQCCAANNNAVALATNAPLMSGAVMMTDYDHVMANNTNAAAAATQHNKMFVGGLAQTVTSEFLRAYFANFGPVQDAFVLMDEQSGRSRGFGFVTFENAQTLKLVLKQKPHILGNKQVDCKHAVNKTGKRSSTGNCGVVNGAGGGSSSSVTLMNKGNIMLQAPPIMGISAPPPTTLMQQSGGPPPPQPAPSMVTPCTNGNIWAYDLMKAQAATIEEPEIVKDDASPFGGEWSDNESSDLFLTGGGKSYLALSGDKWLEDCEEADARKIFVGGLPDITPLEFAKYFEHFGPVADAMIMYDRKRRRQRGFGFITFASDDGVRNSLNFSRHPVKGKVVEVKKAHPLVLQKARAPAKQELEAERAAAAAAAAANPRDPFGLITYNKAPSAATHNMIAAAGNGGGGGGTTLLPMDAGTGGGGGGGCGGVSLFPKYPEAPWHK